MSLVGPGGLLSGLTKQVLETALEAELTEHLGHEHGQTPAGSNVRNGTRSKTVLTEIGTIRSGGLSHLSALRTLGVGPVWAGCPCGGAEDLPGVIHTRD